VCLKNSLISRILSYTANAVRDSHLSGTNIAICLKPAKAVTPNRVYHSRLSPGGKAGRAKAHPATFHLLSHKQVRLESSLWHFPSVYTVFTLIYIRVAV